MSDQPFSLEHILETTNTAALVRMIICWWYDDPDMVDDRDWALEAVDDFMADDPPDWDSDLWFVFVDALGSWQRRTDELEALYIRATEQYSAAIAREEPQE